MRENRERYLYLHSVSGGESAVDILTIPESFGNIDNVTACVREAGNALETCINKQMQET